MTLTCVNFVHHTSTPTVEMKHKFVCRSQFINIAVLCPCPHIDYVCFLQLPAANFNSGRLAECGIHDTAEKRGKLRARFPVLEFIGSWQNKQRSFTKYRLQLCAPEQLGKY